MFKPLVTAFDAIADVGRLRLELAGSRPIQGERRILEQIKPPDKNIDLALVGKFNDHISSHQVPVCSHCKGRGHPQHKC